MFSDDHMTDITTETYDKDQFCLHLMQIHAAGKIRQFVDSLPVEVLESLESGMPELSTLDVRDGPQRWRDKDSLPALIGNGEATSWTSWFLNATLYREAIVAFKQAATEAKSTRVAKMDTITHALANLDADSLGILKWTLVNLNEDKNYWDEVSLGVFLRSLTLNEKDMLENALGGTTLEQTKQIWYGMTKEHCYQLRVILEDMIDKKIRKHVDV